MSVVNALRRRSLATRRRPPQPPADDTLRWALADWLLYRRLSGRELARRAGVSRSTVQRLTSGRGQGVELETLARLCRALNVAPGDLVVWQCDDPLPSGGRARARQLAFRGRLWR